MALLLGYGAGAINPYLAFETIEDLIAARAATLGGIDRAQGGQELHQGRGQGRAQGDVEDGHLHRRVATRGAQVFEAIGLGQELVDEYFTGTVVAASAASASTRSPTEVAARHARRLPRPARASAPTASSSSAASTSGAARASTTCSTRRRCSSCSTRRAPSATTSSRSTRRSSTTSRRSWRRCAACSSCATACARRCRSTRSSRSSEIVKRFSTGAMSLRLDLARRRTRRSPSR